MAYVPPNKRGGSSGGSMPPSNPPKGSDSFRYGGVRGDGYSRYGNMRVDDDDMMSASLVIQDSAQHTTLFAQWQWWHHAPIIK